MNLNSKPFYLNDEQMLWVESTLKSMTLLDKIGQLFCLITYTDDENYLKYLANELNVGGIMLRTMSANEISKTVQVLQENAKVPMLVAANLEAGLNQTCYTGTRVGCEMAIAATGDKTYAKELAKVISIEANALGVNWAFAPVIDIDYNFRNPITNTRTFGSNVKNVAEMGAEYVLEVEKNGIASSIKHFPGDGVDERDQHLLASVNTMHCEEWDDTFGFVYKHCIDSGAKTVMVGHIMLPAYSKKLNPNLKDKDIMPALIAPELLNGLLRDKLGFNGLIVTDSSTMAGMGSIMPREKAVPLTIASGCDMFLFTKNLEEDFAFMRQGVENGTITLQRLDEAVMRILALKASLDLPSKKLDQSIFANQIKIDTFVGCAAHKQISKMVADKSITIVKEEEGVLPVNTDRYKRILVYVKEGKESSTGIGISSGGAQKLIDRLLAAGHTVTKFKPSGGWEGLATPTKEVSANYDLIIYVANLATKSNQTVVRLEWEEPMGADVPVYMHTVPTIFISLENPYHLLDVPRIKTYINTYGSTDEIIDLLIEKLQGKSEFKGKSPIDAFCSKWDTRL